MNYYQFNAEDLAADDYFKEWISSPTPETETFWKAFLREYPERYYQVEEARRLVTGLQAIQQIPASNETVDALWNRIENTLEESRPVPVIHWLNWQRGWKIAASIFLVIGIGFLVRQQTAKKLFPAKQIAQTTDEWVETVNEANQIMQVQLADGSRINLQKGGRLRYQTELTGVQREVYLTGEAFFDVKKNPKRPFVVYANGLVTKVLGTSFQIKALADAPTVTVSVRTGRVSVYPNQPSRLHDPESKGIVLTRIKKSFFSVMGQRLIKRWLKNLVFLSPKMMCSHLDLMMRLRLRYLMRLSERMASMSFLTKRSCGIVR
ncbi:FecR family protein [Spirosoma telluris]|uniref:FecR family protein n=1 Tax=Spirosoma telluris TaxID=2183553 RepID=UPI002FC37117